MVMLGAGAADAELARHAATLRKRFERVKGELRRLAGAGKPAAHAVAWSAHD